jgi:hypothetical protein
VFTLQSLVVDLAQYDLLYRFQQFRPSDLREAIEGVFGWVPASLETALGWTVKNAATVAETIFGAGAMNLRPRIIKTAEILPQCNSIPGEEIQAILRTLTHAETPNKDYVLPEAGKALTLTSKPLVEKSDDTLILLNASFCAPAVFEALAMPISKKDKHAFSKIGTAAETYLRGKIEAKGVIVSRGEYRIGEHRGECDAVIETSDTIIFLELKIKSLTRMARAGWDLDIFADLASSLFAATEQLGRHEIAIRENGILSLKRQDGDVTTILLGHRNIEKVALTFSDFGSFQDRNILTQLFETLLNTHLNANDPAMQPKLEELNELIVAIRKQTVRLAELVPEAKEHPFFNCWFLSVGQLLVLLDEVSSAETFKTELWRCRHLSTSSLDWYSEFDAALRIGAAKPDP